MIGIYKITSPTKKVYIGQTINLTRRIAAYKRHDCANQPRLMASLEKYGFKDHKFELILECSREELDKMEIYWIDFYNSTAKIYGMNCKTGGTSGRFTEETKLKMSNSAKGRIGHMKGKKHTPETCLKMSLSKKGIASPRKGVKLSAEQVEKIASKRRGYKLSEETKKRISISNKATACASIPLINYLTGTKYRNIKDASEILNIPYWSLHKMISGKKRNTTHLQKFK